MLHGGAERIQYVGGTPLDRTPGLEKVMAVSDTGCGMAQETMQRMYEPLYTTKASGTGIGLATVSQIVEQCGGNIAVESELNCGTSFRIYLQNAS
jgi:signal transduction histidine kinase